MEAGSSTPLEIIDLSKFWSVDKTFRSQVNGEFDNKRTRILLHETITKNATIIY